MPAWITAVLQFLGFGAKIAAGNQEIINRPAIVKGKQAVKDQKEIDEIHKSTEKGDLKGAQNDFEH